MVPYSWEAQNQEEWKMLKEMAGGEWRLWAREGLSEIARGRIQVEVDPYLAVLSSFWPGAFVAKSQAFIRAYVCFIAGQIRVCWAT